MCHSLQQVSKNQMDVHRLVAPSDFDSNLRALRLGKSHRQHPHLILAVAANLLTVEPHKDITLSKAGFIGRSRR